MSEAKWYILHTFSGYEKKVADNIQKVVENRNLQHLIEEVMVPTETITENHEGKVKTYESKIYPSYVYVKMVMTDESWYICRNTRGCTGFVGPGSKPIPLTDEEVANLGVVPQTKEVIKSGDLIRIISGTMKDLEGTVNEINEEEGKALVTVSMFGKETPATLDLSAIQKIG
ncbi:MAG: transcription termination/antitermination protein NusG [Ruminiclostridium sp.]|nr:transcription termination/antitermination factor NusG [Oscillospiraceae bacterium]MDE7280980.1 transcription termination/antitermination protein NusG [Ruminiclostridium sp.]